MSLHLYDTSARAIREFVPVEAGRASLYLCGATVQAPPHIGHIRSGVNFDVLRRWLTRSGYDVTFCRNVTDIDDKIIRVAAAEGVPVVRGGRAQPARLHLGVRRARLPAARPSSRGPPATCPR